ncbi:MAG TPA: RNA polymerase sigma factor, partial [Planctomycetota bacterium]|nr:RNA polymerase sigma factor [Planctomycetota bacterium]
MTCGIMGGVQRDALLEHVGFLRALARGLVRCEADAEDVVQETLVTALEKPPAPGNLRAWLGKVATNIARMRHRSRQRALRRELFAHRGDGPPSPAEMAARLEIERRIVDAVTDLREPYRSTILLHFYDGLAPAEIARHLGIPASTVRVRLKRALAIVRARLEHESDDRRGLML